MTTSRSATEPGTPHSRRSSRVAWFVWIAFVLVMSVVVSRQSLDGKHSVVPAYRVASLAWMHSQPIYELETVHGFLYLPSSAVVTAPLALLPQPAHEFAFRWISVGLLAWAVFRLSNSLSSTFGPHAFLILTLCAIATSVGATRAGQMNLVLAATMTLAVADAMAKRWWLAALWIGLGFALKPQAIVLGLLLIAICPPLRIKGMAALAFAVLLPFLFQSPAYVLEQYHLCAQKLVMSGRPSEADVHNNDLSGLLGVIGLLPSENVRWAGRAIAAALILLACGAAIRRKPAVDGLLLTLGFAAVYVVLFNPRTEGGTYLVVAVPVAAFLARELTRLRRRPAALLIGMVVGWSLSYELSQRMWALAQGIGIPTAPSFRGGFAPYWLSPALAIVFLAFLIMELRGNSTARETTRE